MNTTKYLFLVLLTTLIGLSARAQQRNVLQVPDVTTQRGNVQLPVNIENTDEIVGAQFDLTLPTGITAENVGVLANRSDGHTVTVNHLASGVYRVLLHSGSNRPLRGQSGMVMYLPIHIPTYFVEGSEHQLTISNAVLAKATGENVLTEATAGKIRIAKLPDLTVKSIACDKSTAGPGDRIVASWQVENVGELATGGGWSEQVSLVSTDGTLSKLIATTYYNETLAASGIVSRQAEITLPTLLGIDGEVRLQVRIVPDNTTGEPASAQGNNTKRGNNIIVVNKTLTLTISPSQIEENSHTRILAKVGRSGRWTAAETFTINTTNDSRVSTPPSVTIPANQSSATFYIELSDNEVLDDNSDIGITLSGNGYSSVVQTLIIEDNEYPNLTLTASKPVLNEGESFQLTVSTSRASQQPITVTITSENSKRFSFPSTVTIPAGETQASFTVTTTDDEVPSINLSNAFTASAPKHNKAEAIVLLQDNDLPVLELQLTPNTVSESAGAIAVAGVLRRTTNANSKITVKLTDDANGGLYFGNRTLVLEKGVEEVHFNFGPVDNATVDGDRNYTITAAVWLSSCSCSATGESAGSVSAQLRVLDNDGPALGIISSLSTLKEGSTTILTVSRNTTDTSAPLTVTLNSDYENGLTYNHTVTIPAGQHSASVEVTALSNSTQGDSHTVVFTVQAESYATGTCYMMVTDQTLPDARISSIVAVSTLDESVIENQEVGTKVKLTITVSNDGAAELPAEVPVKIYLRGSSTAVGTVYTNEVIAVGGSQTVTKIITLPNTVGQHSYYAVVNESNTVLELWYNNNTSADVSIATISPFIATVSTDKAVYKQGDKVIITGQLTGSNIAESDIDIYLINEGARQVQTVKTDANGAFAYEWQLYALQSGHFAVGACYPSEGAKTEMTMFDVYGLRRTEYNNITCDVICGDTQTGSLRLKNPGNLNLTGVTVEMLSVPETCDAQMTIPSTIGGDQEVQLSYSVKGVSPTVENKWEEIKARVNTQEGVSLDITLYFYCRNAQGKLVASTQRIVTTMNKDREREYSIQVTNIGRGNTGKVSLALPDFIKSLAGNNLPSINQNDTLTIPLSFMPTDDMQLNVPVTGQFGINCENGDGTSVNFSITPVSDETGTLVVDVCDEYTYYTSEAPHVEGAEVVVRNPVTGALVTQGHTNNLGIFSATLPEGYYKLNVTANNHDYYTNNIYVDPGVETRKTINLSTQAITVDWKVEETEVEDEYEIVTTVKFETNVPEPIVELVVPKSLDVDALGVGESLVFYAVLTNKGLITAQDAELILPEGFKRITFEPLTQYQGLTIAPQQSISIPVKVTRTVPANSRMRRLPDKDNDPCVGQPGTLYFWDCGEDRKWHRYGIAMQLGSCRSDDPSTWDNSGNGEGGGTWTGGWPYGISIIGAPNLPGGSTFGSSLYQGLQGTDEGCEPCQNRFLYKMVKCITGRIPVFKEFWEIVDWVEEPIDKATDELRDKALDRLEDGAKRLKPVYGWVKRIIKYVDIWGDCIKPLYEPCDPGNFNGSRRYLKNANSDNNPSYIKEYQETLSILTSAFDADIARTIELFGDSIWIQCDDTELSTFIDMFILYAKDEISYESLCRYKPHDVSNNNLSLFIERWNNTINNVDSENKISIEKYDEYGKVINSVLQYAIDNGYLSMMDMYEEAEEKVIANLNEASKTVCSTITLQIKQKMVMTRQAFRGTLTVFNGHETTAMTDMKLTLNVTNRSTGQVATSHEFQINAESLDGFTGKLDLGSGWSLAANTTGTATILFIPTKYAAPDEPVEWSFGGTLSYIDPFTGLEVTRELYPVTLTVKPSPELDLTYFMQRDVYGDDPMTLDVVEPMKPAEFALLINNKGNGDATNVRMVTQQPEIIENEKGLYIDFELISSQVNGNDAALSFGQSIANDFGTIPAHSQAYAQWWLQSSLLGHFTEYKVETTHVTSYGNENLSLLDEVTIHELIHGFTVKNDGDKPVRGFLVNDIADTQDLPDAVYFTDATQQEAYIASGANIVKQSDTEYVMNVDASNAGWNYGSLLDPTNGKQKLVKVTRADGTEVSVDNVWQTDRTLRDGKDPLYENRLHFVGNMATTGETFYLTFEARPELELAVESFAGVPEEGTVLKEQLKTLTVKFNKPIKAETFTTDDITINCQGVAQDASQIVITKQSEKEYMLTLNEVTLQDGYYVLTVQTANIEDAEGFKGSTGKHAAWIQFVNGKATLKVAALPADGGSITPGSGRYALDSDVTLTATPATGYDFSHWLESEANIGNEPQLTHHVVGDANLTAVFTLRHYDVTIGCDETQGTVTGAATGIYEYGTMLQLTAVPSDDNTFSGWLINGQMLEGATETITITVVQTVTVQAIFAQNDMIDQTITAVEGWNWISTYLNEPVPVEGITIYANRIVSQFDELINDPQFGMVGGITSLMPGRAYKVEGDVVFSETFEGHLYNIDAMPITLNRGWNWIAYPYMYAGMISDVVTNASEGDFIVTQTGFTEFTDGHWQGSIDMLSPGEGCLYKSATNKELKFDFSSLAGQQSRVWRSMRQASAEDMLNIHRYPNTMNITARLYRDGIEQNVGNYHIYAMANNDLRGIAQQVGSNYYLTVYGDEPVDINFVIESAETGNTYVANEVLSFRDDVVGSRKEPFTIGYSSTTGIDLLEDASRPMTVYSLEGILISRDATLKTLRRLPKGIYIVNGQKCYVK